MLRKDADTRYPVNELIRKRWSGRAFSEKMITEEVVEQLLEAASWAPSSMNEQPWRYIIGYKGDENFEKMVNLLNPRNAVWAKDASVLLFSLAKNTYPNGSKNKHAWYDTGAANMNLMLEAAANDIITHVMGGADFVSAKEEFGISDEYDPVVFIALGYHGDPDSLPEPLNTRETAPRKRKPAEEIILKTQSVNEPAHV